MTTIDHNRRVLDDLAVADNEPGTLESRSARSHRRHLTGLLGYRWVRARRDELAERKQRGAQLN
jgi:hypothetical protein